jgi:hypothetical protein
MNLLTHHVCAGKHGLCGCLSMVGGGGRLAGLAGHIWFAACLFVRCGEMIVSEQILHGATVYVCVWEEGREIPKGTT